MLFGCKKKKKTKEKKEMCVKCEGTNNICSLIHWLPSVISTDGRKPETIWILWLEELTARVCNCKWRLVIF